MFETSVVNARAIAAPRKAGVFSVSLALHSLAATAVVVLSVQSTTLPKHAPNMMETFQQVMPVADVPLPRGNPNAPREQPQQPQQQAAQRAQTAPAVPTPETVPNTIPNSVPTVGTDTAGPTTTGGPATGEKWGVPDGDPNAIDLGQKIVQTPTVAVPTGPLVPVGDVKAARVLSRVEPSYPRVALAGHIGGVVKVHCIIDKNGQLSDPEIVFSSFPAFNQPVVDALRRWTFAPGSLHGQAVDTYFELTITFTPK